MLDIGQVVQQTGVPTSTLHVWEAKGLLKPAGRAGLRRQYDPDVICSHPSPLDCPNFIDKLPDVLPVARSRE